MELALSSPQARSPNWSGGVERSALIPCWDPRGSDPRGWDPRDSTVPQPIARQGLWRIRLGRRPERESSSSRTGEGGESEPAADQVSGTERAAGRLSCRWKVTPDLDDQLRIMLGGVESPCFNWSYRLNADCAAASLLAANPLGMRRGGLLGRRNDAGPLRPIAKSAGRGMDNEHSGSQNRDRKVLLVPVWLTRSVKNT